jgi:PAS domain S-box-containing protein
MKPRRPGPHSLTPSPRERKRGQSAPAPLRVVPQPAGMAPADDLASLTTSDLPARDARRAASDDTALRAPAHQGETPERHDLDRLPSQSLFTVAPEEFVVTSIYGIIERASPSTAELFGIRPVFLVGRPLAMFVHPSHRRDFRSALTRAVSCRRPGHWELLLKPRHGQPISALVSVFFIGDRPGKPEKLGWLIRDITERKQAEERVVEHGRLAAVGADVGKALAESGSLQEILENCAEAVVRHLDAAFARIWTVAGDAHGVELQACAAADPHLGAVPARMPMGDYKVRLILQERRPHLTNSVANDPQIAEHQWVQREGVVAFAGCPLLIGDHLVGVLTMFARRPLTTANLDALSSITREIALGIERKRAEEKAAGALAELQNIMQSIPDIVYTLDLDNRLIRWNTRLEMVTGFVPDELLGKPAAEFFPEDERGRILAAIHETFVTGHTEVEGHLLRKDGTLVPYLWNAAPLKDPQGRVIGLAGAGRDMTERKEAERSMLELSGRLLQLQDEEQRRIARELHDSTAQLLAGLSMNLTLARSRNRMDPPARKALAESAALADECLREVRTISHLLHPPLLDEVGLASAVRWYADGFAERSGIPVDVHIAPDLARLPEKLEIALFRVVQESLTNVHRHTTKAEVRIEIHRTPSTVTLEVTDTGPGIPRAVLENGQDGNRRLGVGIMGMRERLRQLGGQLNIRSSRRGTAIQAVLPLRGEGTDDVEPTFER